MFCNLTIIKYIWKIVGAVLFLAFKSSCTKGAEICIAQYFSFYSSLQLLSHEILNGFLQLCMQCLDYDFFMEGFL